MQRTALVVGDRALTDPQLWEALLERDAATTSYYVVVPAIPLREQDHELVHSEGLTRANESVHVAVARWRLRRTLKRFEETGLVADGEVGPTDEFKATISALERVRPSEVIISTPGGSSFRSRSKGLPSRLREHTDVPVTVIAGSVRRP